MMKILNSSVLLKDVRIFAFHGALPQERTVGAYFILNLSVQTDFSRALATDDLDGTISYAALFDLVKSEMTIPSRLLEHVAGRICTAIFHRFPTATSVHLEILKENPPMGADCPAAGISLDVARE